MFLDRLAAAHRAGRLAFHGELAALAEAGAFAAHLVPLRRTEWVVYAQSPLRRARSRARLPVALHPPLRHRQQPADCHGRARRHLPLEGLPRPGRRKGSRMDQDPDDGPGTSSSAASCFMCCPTASTASATTVCSPAARGPPTSPGSEACSRPRRRRVRPSPSTNPPPASSRPQNPSAHAAADASSSSSASAAARFPSCARAPLGPTRHDRRPEPDRYRQPTLRGTRDPHWVRSRREAHSRSGHPLRHCLHPSRRSPRAVTTIERRLGIALGQRSG